MKLILQQVKSASVLLVDTGEKREIWHWMLVYACFEQADLDHYTNSIEKSVKLFGKMKMLSLWSEKIDQSLADVDGELLVISNFSIAGRMQKWQKVDFSRSASFAEAKQMYDAFLDVLGQQWFRYKSGEFGAKMEIESKVWWPLNYYLEL